MNREALPLWKATYRVLVLTAIDARETQQKVNAICLERNLVGRGCDAEAALGDLAKTVVLDLETQWAHLLPEPPCNPDPELDRAYEERLPETSAGEIVLQRALLHLEKVLVRSSQALRGARPPTRPRPRVTFEPQVCLA